VRRRYLRAWTRSAGLHASSVSFELMALGAASPVLSTWTARQLLDSAPEPSLVEAVASASASTATIVATKMPTPLVPFLPGQNLSSLASVGVQQQQQLHGRNRPGSALLLLGTSKAIQPACFVVIAGKYSAKWECAKHCL
jgi:hypothetical protein